MFSPYGKLGNERVLLLYFVKYLVKLNTIVRSLLNMFTFNPNLGGEEGG